MNARKISFDQILSVWQTELWPNRQSDIETHSAMTWPYSWPETEIDMEIFNYDATFFGVFSKQQLIGVNSGHKSSEVEYRSRGIWVDPAFRKTGVSQILFGMTEDQAMAEGCEMIWSIPRKTALKAYTKFGFMTVGDYFNTETSDSNIYVLKRL